MHAGHHRAAALIPEEPPAWPADWPADCPARAHLTASCAAPPLCSTPVFCYYLPDFLTCLPCSPRSSAAAIAVHLHSHFLYWPLACSTCLCLACLQPELLPTSFTCIFTHAVQATNMQRCEGASLQLRLVCEPQRGTGQPHEHACGHCNEGNITTHMQLSAYD